MTPAGSIELSQIIDARRAERATRRAAGGRRG